MSLLTVMGVYSYSFGIGLWEEHQKWAEMGSFFGGVLGPILAFCSLLYLAYQVEMQRKQHEITTLNLEKNNKEAYLALCLNQLVGNLEKVDETLQQPLGELLVTMTKDKRLLEELKDLIKLGLSSRAETMALWVNISAALSYLQKVDEHRYLDQKTLVAVRVGIQLCQSLDTAVHIATDIDFQKHFKQ